MGKQRNVFGETIDCSRRCGMPSGLGPRRGAGRAGGRSTRGTAPCVPIAGEEADGWASLAELAVSYRAQAEALSGRIREVRALDVESEEERVCRRERLRLLEAMRREVREVAVLCQRYYDRGYRRNQRYII